MTSRHRSLLRVKSVKRVVIFSPPPDIRIRRLIAGGSVDSRVDRAGCPSKKGSKHTAIGEAKSSVYFVGTCITMFGGFADDHRNDDHIVSAIAADVLFRCQRRAANIQPAYPGMQAVFIAALVSRCVAIPTSAGEASSVPVVKEGLRTYRRQVALGNCFHPFPLYRDVIEKRWMPAGWLVPYRRLPGSASVYSRAYLRSPCLLQASPSLLRA